MPKYTRFQPSVIEKTARNIGRTCPKFCCGLLRLTKQAQLDTEIEINDIEVARVYEGVRVREEYEPAMAAGAELGVRHVTASVWCSDKNHIVDKFGEICDPAASYAMTVNVEFVTWACVRNIPETLSLFEQAGRKNVGILVDSLHFHRSQDTIEELKALPASYFNYVHLCDTPAEIPTDMESLIKTGRGERLYVGEGAIDMRAIVARFPQAVIGLELPHLQRAREIGVAEHARRCLASCKAYLGD